MPRTLARLKSGEPVRVLAMPPYDKLIGPAFRAVFPAARVEVKPWSVDGQSLAQIEEASKGIRAAPPDLVLVAVPAAVTPQMVSPPEEAIRAYTWVLNWALSFGRQEWDVVGIAPAVCIASPSPEERGADEFARRRILAQDLNLVARANGDAGSPERILEDWLRLQVAGK
jgi:hypothetical protein